MVQFPSSKHQMFYNGPSTVLYIFDLKRSKVKVKEAKIVKMPKLFLAVTLPQFSSSKHQNVPILKAVCLLCLGLQIFLFVPHVTETAGELYVFGTLLGYPV